MLDYHGDHFITYAKVKTLYSIPETNVISPIFQLKKKIVYPNGGKKRQLYWAICTQSEFPLEYS